MIKARQNCEVWTMPALTVAMVVTAIVAVYMPQGRKLQSIKTTIASRKLALDESTKRPPWCRA